MINEMHETRAALELLMQSCLIFSGAVLAVALIRPLLLRFLGASAAYGCWLLLPVALLAQALPSGTAEPVPLAAVTAVAPSAPAAAPLAMALPVASPRLSPTQALGMLALWGAGALLCAGFMRVQQGRLQRSLSRSDAGWRSPAGSSPALIGCWPQRLVLPADFEQRFDAQEQALILAHEQVHARRHDNRWNLLAAVLLALQWFNPLAWWAWRRMRADQELACDAAVLQQAGTGLPSYTSALLKSCHAAMPMGLSSRWGLRHPLLERVRLLNARAPAAWARRSALPLLLSIGAGTGVLVQAAVPLLPTLPVEQSQPARSVLQSKGPVVQLELRTQQAEGEALGTPIKLGFSLLDWRQRQGDRSISYRIPLEGWCLNFRLNAMPDGSTRPHAAMLDADCEREIGAAAPLDAAGSPTVLQQTSEPGKAPRQVQLRMSTVDPQSKEFALLRSNTQLRPTPQLQEQDKAWRRARGELAPPPAPPVPPPPPPAPPPIRSVPQAEPTQAEPMIELRMAIELSEVQEGKKETWRSQPVLQLAPGQHATVMLRGSQTQASADQIALDFWAEDLGESKVKVWAEIKKGDPLQTVSSPRVVTRDGTKARIEMGREDANGNKEMLSIDVTPTVLGKARDGA